MVMAATSDEEMEHLIQNFEQIYQGYKDALMEIQSLKLNYNSETRRREALEATCKDLKTDNDRLRRLYTEYLNKMTNQIKYRTRCQNLEEDLKKANDRLLELEGEHRKTKEMLKQENELKILDLEMQVSYSLHQQAADEATIKQLQKDLAAYETHIGILTNKLEQVTVDMNSKYHHEIQDLKDWILVEQEEKKELQKKLDVAENELQIIKTKQAKQQRDSISMRHVETLKQKIMKLRKENESLKRQLTASKLDGA